MNKLSYIAQKSRDMQWGEAQIIDITAIYLINHQQQLRKDEKMSDKEELKTWFERAAELKEESQDLYRHYSALVDYRLFSAPPS